MIDRILNRVIAFVLRHPIATHPDGKQYVRVNDHWPPVGLMTDARSIWPDDRVRHQTLRHERDQYDRLFPVLLKWSPFVGMIRCTPYMDSWPSTKITWSVTCRLFGLIHIRLPRSTR
ncbi:hypothetical protein PSQ19_06080 [Devosia algicola]|uniref:Uncharacterized protein n=1 Tax=Devosia algicola TaxID=3026418 RepID=A0ABY7YQN3_9HYPH|nr:hypothetical protein [Devosia algicola]WDR03636.1 hypothetical protein PSQ19_06080 [Devosia algicola]